MQTEIFSKNTIDQAAQYLRDGELIAFPTETVYGLGASLFQQKAIAQIFHVKNRPQDNPLIVHIASLSEVEDIAIEIPETFYVLAEAFFPGPLTLVLQKHPQVPSLVSRGLDTIAVRMPSNPIARALIAAVKEPLVAPSANLSGRPSSTTHHHVLQDFSGKIKGVIDGGPCQHGIESTVVDLVSFEKPTILRYGAIDRQEIEAIFPLAEYTQGPKSSPGMKYRHYAPNIPVCWAKDKDDFALVLDREKRQFILSDEPLAVPYQPLQTSRLYGDLRFAEESGYDEVVICAGEGISRALAHRLEKIAHASDLH